jgi:hypothetical protein
MRLVAVLVGGVVLPFAAPVAAFGADGFGEPSRVGAGPVSFRGVLVKPVAAVNARGDAALAWSDGAQVHVARRARGAAWSARTISRPADLVPDLQLALTPTGDAVVAWTETLYDRQVKGGGVPDWFHVAVAPARQPFGRAHVIARGAAADSALPRLAALADGRVVLVWRKARLPRGGELQMAFLGSDGRVGRSTQLGLDGVAPSVVATVDGGALVTWANTGPQYSRHPGRFPHRVFAAQLPPRGRALRRAFQITSSAIAGAKLAAGPDGIVMASWASRGRPRGLLAAQIAPRRGPVRVLRPGEPKATAASLAVGPDRSTLATFFAPSLLRPPGSGTPGDADEGSGQWVATGTVGDGFAARVELPTTSPQMPGIPAILPTGEALVAWSQRDGNVLVARRPAGSISFAPAESLSSGQPSAVGALVTVAQAADRVLIAWPGGGRSGGMVVATRP